MEDITCPCCGYKTLSEIGAYEICPVCFWEDDPTNRDDPNYDGANGMSLKQGQRNYIEIGACDSEMKRYTRAPDEQENQDPNWSPLE